MRHKSKSKRIKPANGERLACVCTGGESRRVPASMEPFTRADSNLLALCRRVFSGLVYVCVHNNSVQFNYRLSIKILSRHPPRVASGLAGRPGGAFEATTTTTTTLAMAEAEAPPPPKRVAKEVAPKDLLQTLDDAETETETQCGPSPGLYLHLALEAEEAHQQRARAPLVRRPVANVADPSRAGLKVFMARGAAGDEKQLTSTRGRLERGHSRAGAVAPSGAAPSSDRTQASVGVYSV